MVRIQVNAISDGNGADLTMNQSDVYPESLKKLDEIWNNNIWKPLDGVLIRSLSQFIFFEGVSPHDIYDVLLDTNKLTKLTKTKCDISKTVGSDFELYDASITGKNITLVTDTKIVQKWRRNDWPPALYSTVIIELSRVAGGTDMKFFQAPVPVEKFAVTFDNWEKLFWKKIRKAENKSLGLAIPPGGSIGRKTDLREPARAFTTPRTTPASPVSKSSDPALLPNNRNKH